MRSMLVCSVLGLSMIGVMACSSKSASSVFPPASAAIHLSMRDGDGDIDSPGSRHDPDNDEVLTFGQAADAADRRALTVLLRHYYAVAAADDGAKACSLLYAPTVESLVEEHEGRNGLPSLPGSTCAQVASKLFAQRHRELARQIAALEVTEVHVKGNRGFVRLRFAATPEHLVVVNREGRAWKVGILLDQLGV